MTSNDKTEQPIPAEELDRIASDALYNCPKDAPAGSEAGRWKHGYIQGGKTEYARAHPLPPSPVGEAGEKAIKCSFGLTPNLISTIEAHLSKVVGLGNDLIWEAIGKEIGWHPLTACLYYFQYLQNRLTAEEICSMYTGNRPANPSRAGEIRPVLPRWVKASDRKPPKGKGVIIRAENDRNNKFITRGQNTGHEEMWETGTASDWFWYDTEWLEEAPPTPAPEVKAFDLENTASLNSSSAAMFGAKDTPVEQEDERPGCWDGRCTAPKNVTGIANCLECGGELQQVGNFWYHHSSFENGKLLEGAQAQDCAPAEHPANDLYNADIGKGNRLVNPEAQPAHVPDPIDHIHVNLPSGARATVSPDASPELLNALDRMVQLAKGVPDPKEEVPEEIIAWIEFIIESWFGVGYEKVKKGARDVAIAMYRKTRREVAMYMEVLEAAKTTTDGLRAQLATLNTKRQRAEDNVQKLIGDLAAKSDEAVEFRQTLYLALTQLEYLGDKSHVSPMVKDALAKYPNP